MNVKRYIQLSAAFTFATYAFAEDVDARIAQVSKEIKDLSDQLEHVQSPVFNATHQVQAELSFEPINAWLKEITTPEFTVRIVGVRSHGELIYKPGTAKVWLEPAHDTNASLHIRKFQFAGDRSGIGGRLELSADAETRARFSIGGVGGNVFGEGKLQPTPIGVRLALGNVANGTIPYEASLRAPQAIYVNAILHLGSLPDYNFKIPLGNMSQSLGKGQLPLALSESWRIDLPVEAKGGILFKMTAKDQELQTSERGIAVKSNFTISASPSYAARSHGLQ